MNIQLQRRQRIRGAVLLTAMLFIAIASITLAMMTKALQDNARLVDRKSDSIKALKAAESGVAFVMHLFNRPELYSEDVTYGNNPFVSAPNDVTDFTPMVDLLAGGDLVLDPAIFPLVNYDDGEREGASITSITLRSASAFPSAVSNPIALVTCVATSSKFGIEREVEAGLRGPINFTMQAPAALLSYDSTYTTGNVMVHWGESWSEGNIEMSNQPRFYSPSIGGTLAVRSEQNITFNGGSWGMPNWVNTDGSIQEVWPESTNAGIREDFENRLYSNQDLEFPVYEYEELKELSKQFGEYYTTDADGWLYRDGIETEANRTTFDAIMSVDTNGVMDGESSEFSKFVFIDTIDGNPPDRVNQSNLADLRVSGNVSGNRFMRGFWFVNASVDFSGIGSSSVLVDVEVPPRPDNWPASVEWSTNTDEFIEVISDGIVLFAGNLEVTGNPGFRGSLITYGAISGAGTPNVYWDPDLSDGININALSRVEMFAYRVVR